MATDLGKSARFRLNGTEVHLIEAGRGPAVLLIHTLGDSHRTWRRLLPQLAAQRRRVIAIDLPGHGRSGHPDASYSLDFHVTVLRELKRALRVRHFDLVGHDFGGSVAMAFCRAQPHAVRSLALVASGGLALPGAGGLVGSGLGSRLNRLFTDDERAAAAEREWHAYANAAPGKRLAVLWGDRDPVLPYVHALRIADALPGTELYRLRGAAHAPHLERPEAFFEALAVFLFRGRLPVVAPAPLLLPRRAPSHA